MLASFLQTASQTSYGRQAFVRCAARQSLPKLFAAQRLVLHCSQTTSAGVRPHISRSAAGSTALMEAAPQPLKRARKAKNLAANKPLPPATPEQLVGIKQEANGNGHVTSTPFLVVQTEGLAAAAALTGSAEPSVQIKSSSPLGTRARKKKKKAAMMPAASAPTAVSAAPAQLAPAVHQPGQPAAGPAAVGSSRSEEQQQPAGPTLQGMPQIPPAEAAKLRGRGRKKSAAVLAVEAAAAAAVKTEDAPAEAPAKLGGRGRKKSAAAPATVAATAPVVKTEGGPVEAPAVKGRKRAGKAVVKAKSEPEAAIDAAAAAPAEAPAAKGRKRAGKAGVKAKSEPDAAIDAAAAAAAAAPAPAKAPGRRKAAPKADMAAAEVPLLLFCAYYSVCMLGTHRGDALYTA